MAKGKVIILSGPSGSGKTTLYKKLLDDKRFKVKLARSISVTTRPKRRGERHGRDYFFVSPKMFLYKKRRGHFLESENVFGNQYGTPLSGVKQLLRSGKNALLCIDVKGARTVRRKLPDAVSVFIKAPSMGALSKRLKERGSDRTAAVEVRLKTARSELKEAKKYEYTVINDRLDTAYRRLVKIIEAEIG